MDFTAFNPCVGVFDVGAQLYRVKNFEVRAEYGVSVGGSYLAQTVNARRAYYF